MGKIKESVKVINAQEGNYRNEYMFTIKQEYTSYQHYNQLVEECDKELEKQLDKMTCEIKDILQKKK